MKNILVVLIVLSFTLGCNESSHKDDYVKRMEMLKAENEALRDSVQNYRIKADSLEGQLNSIMIFWLKKDAKNFSYGLRDVGNPKQFIKDALQNKPEMIPAEGTLGGSYFFTEMQFIGEYLIVAEYSDGHNVGRSVIAFESKSNNTLEFKVLSSVLL